MRTPLALLLCALLSACGFRPVYGEQYQAERAAATASMGQIEVSTDTTRLGQLLNAELIDRLNPTNAAHDKLYRLTVALTEVNVPLFVAPDGTYGRGNIQFSANYSLARIADNTEVDSGSITRVSSYSASEQNAIYASYVAQQDARKRGVVELANDLALRMGNRLNDASLSSTEGREKALDPAEVQMRNAGTLSTLGVDR